MVRYSWQRRSRMNRIRENLGVEDGINLKELLQLASAKWHWFFISATIGLWLGFLFYKYSPSEYRNTSTILAKEEQRGVSVENLFESGPLNTNRNIQNQLGILTAFTLHLQVLENLNWSFSWYKKDLFSDQDLYEISPFILKMEDGFENSIDIPIMIQPLSDERYKLSIKVTGGLLRKIKDEIDIEKILRYGELFHNDLFHFTLDKVNGRNIEVGEDYILVFNKIEKLARAYQARLKINLIYDKADLIRLQLDGSNPQRSIDYLNELTKEYIKFGLYQKNRASENTVRFIDDQLVELVDSLQLAGKNVMDFKSENKIVNLGQEAGLVIQRLKEVESQTSTAELRLEYYYSLTSYINDAGKMEQVVVPSVLGITDPALNALVIKLSELYSKRNLISRAGEKNPILKVVDSEIQFTKESLEENMRNLISHTELELESLRQRKYRIESRLSKLPKTEQKLIDVKRSFDINNELYTFLLKKRAESAIINASNVSDLQILDPARLSTTILLGPNLLRNVFAGICTFSMIPLIIIIFNNLLKTTIDGKEDLENRTSIPILGTIIHSSSKSHLPVIEFPKSAVSESFRSLRTNLLYFLKNQTHKVICVQSANTNDGKTFVSLNLASIIAANNFTVLLVGADLRNPSFSKMVNTSGDKGLATYLTGQHNFDEVIEWTSNNLSCISAGPIPAHPSELLSKDSFQKFIDAAKQRFDFIVIDNAPVTLVTDGLLVGKQADINLVVFRDGHTRKNMINEINDLADKNLMSNVFLVFNDLRIKKNGYGYGHNYYHKEKKAYKKELWSSVLSKN